MRYARDGSYLNDLGTFPGQERFFERSGHSIFLFSAILGRQTTYATGNGRLYVGANDQFEVRVIDTDGTPSTLIRVRRDPVSVTGAHVAERREQQAASARTESARERVLEAFDAMPEPETLPAFERISVDDEGFLWVEEYSVSPADPRPALVFDSAGVALGTIELPGAFTPHHIGADFVLGLWRDDFDVEHVLMYDLDRTP